MILPTSRYQPTDNRRRAIAAAARSDLEPEPASYVVIGTLIATSSFLIDSAAFDAIVAERLRALEPDENRGRSHV